MIEATPEQRPNCKVSGAGYGIHWPDIDVNLSGEGLLRGAPVAPEPPTLESKLPNPPLEPAAEKRGGSAAIRCRTWVMADTSSVVFLCCHCGNVTSQTQLYEYAGSLLYEELDDRQYLEPFDFVAYSCGTCSGLTLTGCFRHEQPEPMRHQPPRPVLYPREPFITPASHTVSPDRPVPATVARVFSEAWPLRHTAPSAFANQIRRGLEYVCTDQKASGQTLADQLRDLESRGSLPSGLARMAGLVRQLGNVGSHADTRSLDRWDAELLDALFQTILDYVYIGPARIARLEERMGVQRPAKHALGPSPGDE